MTRDDWKKIQTLLASAGFNPGPIDGIPGQRTLNAVRNFQARHFLKIDGIVGPITLKALQSATKTTGEIPVTLDPPWLVIAKSKLGLIETQQELKDFLRKDGGTVGDPSKIPWCGDYVQTCILLAIPGEIVPANPYWAMNWMGFGVDAGGPKLGAICVFERPGGGHVGFAVGHDAKYVHVLGGNQSNSVSITKVSKEGKTHLLGYRYPKGQKLPPSDLPVSTLAATINATLS